MRCELYVLKSGSALDRHTIRRLVWNEPVLGDRAFLRRTCTCTSNIASDYVYVGLSYFRDRYSPRMISWNPLVHWAGFAIFSINQRTVYWIISEATLVNLNYTMCTSLGRPNINKGDPMYAIFGKTYLFAAEFYLGIPSFVFRFVYIAIIWFIHWMIEPYIRKSKVVERGFSPESPIKKQK